MKYFQYTVLYTFQHYILNYNALVHFLIISVNIQKYYGVDGFLIKNRDVNEFADRVCQLIEDIELRVRMGQAAVKSAQRYRADLIMPKWKELFERLCQKE